MRKITAALHVILGLSATGLALAQPSGESGQAAPQVHLPAAFERPADSRLAKITEWILREEPAYPAQFLVAAAQRLIDDQGVRRADALEAILNGGAPSAGDRSALLRHMAAALTTPQQAAMRETIAKARILAVLNDAEPGNAPADPADLLGKIKTASQVQHRRVLEGRVEDDELVSLLKKARGDAPTVARKIEPKVLSAADIVSEFSRKNIAGTALDRLQAYSIEATMRPPAGEPREILLVRMRPDRFRLSIKSGGLTQQVISTGSRGYWTHAPGQVPKAVTAEALGDLVRLGEFLNPFLRQEGSEFVRLDDGSFDGRAVHRIRVTRADGSHYDSCIDRETFREIGREHPGGSVTRFSDFRDVAGIAFAFREETTDAAGQKTVVEIARIRPNHGIVPSYFEPPESNDAFYIDRLTASTGSASAKGNP